MRIRRTFIVLGLLVTTGSAFADGLGAFDDVGTPALPDPQASRGKPQNNPWADPSTVAATNAQDCTAKSYLASRPDVVAANMDAVDHYNQYGKNEKMCHPKECTSEAYLASRPDVVAANMTARDHFNQWGLNEGMCEPPKIQSGSGNGDPEFNPAANSCTPAYYLRVRPDVAAARVDPYCHWQQYGMTEGMCRPNTGQNEQQQAAACAAAAAAPPPAPAGPAPAPADPNAQQCSDTVYDATLRITYSVSADPNNCYHRALRAGEWYSVNSTVVSCGPMTHLRCH